MRYCIELYCNGQQKLGTGDGRGYFAYKSIKTIYKMLDRHFKNLPQSSNWEYKIYTVTDNDSTRSEKLVATYGRTILKMAVTS